MTTGIFIGGMRLRENQLLYVFGAPGKAWERGMERPETFHWDPVGSQPHPGRLASHPEASLAWRWGDPPCEA